MKNGYHDDIIYVKDDDMVDISSGKAKKNTPLQDHIAAKDKKNKRIAAITSTTLAVIVIIAGIVGFCVMQGKTGEGQTGETQVQEFEFGDNVYVSGISLAGKNMKQAKALLQLSEKSFVNPKNINIDIDGENTALTQDDFTYTFNIDEILEKAKSDSLNKESKSTDSTEKMTYEVTATVDADSVKARAIEIADSNQKKATNAYVSKFHPYSDDRFEYTEAVQGLKIDSDDLNNQLSGALSGKDSEYRIVAKTESIDADITVADIKKNVVKLATYETHSTNTANGTSNMKVSLEACNGSVIDPGDTWSFNACTGDSNLESNGYKSAHVISEGKLVDGIGGGICQSSSTIYNAAIRANMEVEERYCHKWASSYVPTGLDATIDYPNLDLKLSNPTDYQMFMECKVVDSTLSVSIWGYKSSSYDTIKTENKLTDQGSSSYSVKAWRVYYKDGQEVDRESLGSSTYDNEYGVVFIDAANDSGAKTEDSSSHSSSSDNRSSNDTNYNSSSSSESNSENSSSSSSSSSSKPDSESSSESEPDEPSHTGSSE